VSRNFVFAVLPGLHQPTDSTQHHDTPDPNRLNTKVKRQPCPTARDPIAKVRPQRKTGFPALNITSNSRPRRRELRDLTISGSTTPKRRHRASNRRSPSRRAEEARATPVEGAAAVSPIDRHCSATTACRAIISSTSRQPQTKGF
jgi:hypothetical protein